MIHTTMFSSDHMVQNGHFYGYPECCIQEFVEPFQKGKSGKWWDRSQVQIDARKHGFIPCKAHAEEILQGRIRIEQLIQPTRKCTKKFGFNSRGIPQCDHPLQKRF
jgi:hypothetical protein